MCVCVCVCVCVWVQAMLIKAEQSSCLQKLITVKPRVTKADAYLQKCSACLASSVEGVDPLTAWVPNSASAT